MILKFPRNPNKRIQRVTYPRIFFGGGGSGLKINSEILKKWLGDAVPAPSNHGSTLGDSGSALWSKEIASERSQRVFLRSNLRNITKALFQSLRKKAKELSREQTRETKLKHFSSCFEKKKKELS
jgi:hypothetical protein